jgi:hypothetical protein
VDSQRPLQPPLEQDGFESAGRGVYSGLSTVRRVEIEPHILCYHGGRGVQEYCL